MKLFILHHAGGNSYSYRFLEKYISNYEIVHLELPGRGKRIKEPVITDPLKAVEDITLQIKALASSPFIIYGHSLGALIAYASVLELRKHGITPERIIVSGNPGPSIRSKKAIHLLPDDKFKDELIKLGGMAKEVIENEELMNFFMPILKADFKLAEEIDAHYNTPINIPIYALMGNQEEYVHQIENWSEYTDVDFEFKVLDGDHFFVNNHPQGIADIIVGAYD